jgi:hypothetical protein
MAEKKDALREKVEADLDAQSEGMTERRRRVFQCLDATHPSQMVTLSVVAHKEGNIEHPARSRTLKVNGAGQFILAADAPDYEEQYIALKKAERNPHKWPMIELGGDKENVLPKFLKGKKGSPQEQLVEAQRKIDETSIQLSKGAEVLADKEEALAKAAEEKKRNAETIKGLNGQIEAMKKDIAALKKAAKPE